MFITLSVTFDNSAGLQRPVQRSLSVMGTGGERNVMASMRHVADALRKRGVYMPDGSWSNSGLERIFGLEICVTLEPDSETFDIEDYENHIKFQRLTAEETADILTERYRLTDEHWLYKYGGTNK